MSADDNYVPSPESTTAPSATQQKHPCVLCQQRKVKCDRLHPCGNCKKASAKCISSNTLPPRKRKRRFPEAELLARIRKYEHYLKGYGADLDAINREDVIHGSVTPPPNKHAQIDAPDAGFVRPLSIRRSLKNVENNIWIGMNEEFREAEEILQGSSEDENFEAPITKTYNSTGADNAELLLGGPAIQNLRSIHPSPVRIFRLWQAYLDNVNPLTKIFHAPSIQIQLLEATSNLDNIPKGMEALMFGIYGMAIASLQKEDCHKIFGDEKMNLLSRYHSALRQALINSGYLRSSDILVLQAFTLYLYTSLQLSTDPRTLFCLTGIAVRIGQRIGLSADGTAYGLLPFEVEMRRRLWWQIILIDSRVAEISGAGPTLITYSWATKLPSNINDSDLYPDMRDPPVERSGLTESLFVRLKSEVLQFISTRLRVGSQTLAQRDAAIYEFEERIEKDYLALCDLSIPLHFFSVMITRSTILKLRLGSRHPNLSSMRTATISQQDKDLLFRISLSTLETYNILLAAPLLRRFVWQTHFNFPLPALIFLVCSLRYRTTGELSDKAWQLLQESEERHNLEGFRKRSESAMRHALSNLIVKAWEAREATFSDYQAPPPFILKMREQLASKRGPSSTSNSNSALKTPIEGRLGGSFEATYQLLDPRMIQIGQDLFPDQYEILPNANNASCDWMFWNNLTQGNEEMQRFDGIMQQNFNKDGEWGPAIEVVTSGGE